MVFTPKTASLPASRLLAAVLLLACPRTGSAAGTWSVISLSEKPGAVMSPTAVAVNAVGDLYVADSFRGYSRIQERDVQGRWFALATFGSGLGQVSHASGLAVDATGNLYVAEAPDGRGGGTSRIQRRDPQGNWSLIATTGEALGQVSGPAGLAVDAKGDLYVADGAGLGRVQKRDAQRHWTVIATVGTEPGQVNFPSGLAVDASDNLYVADYRQVQKRDDRGNWSVLASRGAAPGQVAYPSGLAVDATGNLYVAEGQYGNRRIQIRDIGGSWSVIAPTGTAPGQVLSPRGVALDPRGGLYVADTTNDNDTPNGNHGRIQKRDVRGQWSVIATTGDAPGQVFSPTAVAVDSAGNLYVADQDNGGARIQRRDSQGNWSLISGGGPALGHVVAPVTLAVDPPPASGYPARAAGGGSLYVADAGGDAGRIQKRDAHGNWSVIATEGALALAADAASDLYVAGAPAPDYTAQIQLWDAHGNRSDLARHGTDVGQVSHPSGLAVDKAGNLYVSELSCAGFCGEVERVQARDARGNWSQIAAWGTDLGQVFSPSGLAVDSVGTLYVADQASTGSLDSGRIQQRDARGSWSLLAAEGIDLGQVSTPSALAVDGAGNLYVADSGNNRVLKYAPDR